MILAMPRFQSRLFNWIDQSLPAQIGRSVRRSLDQKLRQLAGLTIQELPRLLAYQVAKAALYPVYLITSTVKRTFPALDRSKVGSKEVLRSQPESAGLLSESEVIAENIKTEFPKTEIPTLLRPLAKFLNWIDRAKIRLDRNITALIKRQSNNLATSETTEAETKLIANRIFAEIWRQKIEQDQSEQNSLKESNGLAENVALGKNTRLEQLRHLIAAAIDYFFGKQRSQTTLDETSDITPNKDTWLTMEDVFGDDNGPWPLPLEYESIAFSKSPDRIAIHSSGELQNFETTTTQISQDRLEGNLVFEENFLDIQQEASDSENDRPLRAWIEAQVTILGYAYNPVMTVVFWIDMIVLKVENVIINLWKVLIILPKRLVNFIRFGNK